MRLFVSVDLDGLEDSVAKAQKPFRDVDGLRPVDPEQVHLTLKFLGETQASNLSEVKEALAAAVADSEVSPFTAEFGGYGVFPSLDYISVIWLGVQRGGDSFIRLHEAVEAWTVELGFEPAEHDFTPHVTLARMDHAANKDHVQQVVQERDPRVATLEVTEIRLTESTLTADGPEYSTRESFSLEE